MNIFSLREIILEMSSDRLCCYNDRLCNKTCVDGTGYCAIHIMNSRFADDLGIDFSIISLPNINIFCNKYQKLKSIRI